MRRRDFLRLLGAAVSLSALGRGGAVNPLLQLAYKPPSRFPAADEAAETIAQANAATGPVVAFRAGQTYDDAQLVAKSGLTYTRVGPGDRPVLNPGSSVGTAISGQDLTNTTVDGLEVVAGSEAAAVFRRTTGTTVRNSHFRDAPNDCLLFIEDNDNLVIEDTFCTGSTGAAGAGAASAGFEWADGGVGATIRRLSSKGNVYGAAIHNHDHTASGGIVTDIPTDLLVEDSELSENTDLGLRLVKQAASPPIAHIYRDCRFNGNTNDGVFVDSTTGVTQMEGSILFEGGEVKRNGRYAVNLEGNDLTFRDMLIVADKRFTRIADCKRLTIENCTIVADAATTYWLLWVWLSNGQTEDLTVRNNIFAVLDNTVPLARIELAVPGIAIDHNLWVKATPGTASWHYAGANKTFATWQALGFDANGAYSADATAVFQDPGNGDFRLKAGSPAIGLASDGGNVGALGVA